MRLDSFLLTHFLTCSLQTKNNLIKTKKKDDPSGSRTLLRLHRALEYITEFLGKLEDLEDETFLSQVSKDAYETTLMKYHPWIVQVKKHKKQIDCNCLILTAESCQTSHGTSAQQARTDKQSCS